jgi:hypothetical protein
MDICCIGRDLEEQRVETLEFQSRRTLLDFDVALIDLHGLRGDSESMTAAPSMHRRKLEIQEFLGLGRSVVVFLYDFELDALLPVQGIRTVASAGRRMDFSGPDCLKQFWSRVQESMAYVAYLDGVDGTPFLFVSKTSRPVATWIKRGRGNLLLFPQLMGRRGPSDYDFPQQCRDFMEALVALIPSLSPHQREFRLPPWSSRYDWQRLRDLQTGLLSLQQQAAELSKSIEETSRKLEAEERWKTLFTAKGDVLAETVIEAFRELGAKAEPGAPGRDDVVVEFAGKHAVVEVKGKKSSAAEADAAQLLGLLLTARAHPEKRVDLVNSLFSTVGIYRDFSDYRAFLDSPGAAT